MGEAPDIGAYEYGDSVYWIPGYRYPHPSFPIPRNNAVDVIPDYSVHGIIHIRRIISGQQQPLPSMVLVSIEPNYLIIQTMYVFSHSNQVETTPGPLWLMERVVVCGRFK